MRKLAITAALFALLLAPQAFANHYADFYVIPVAIDAPGANGTQWLSDVAIYNFLITSLEVEMLFIESGENDADNVVPIVPTLLPIPMRGGQSALLKDVLNELPGDTKIGAILIGGNQAFAVTSRAYSLSPTGDTVGQTVLPVRDFLENAVGDTNNANATAYLPGIISNDRFRTNIGFVAATANNSVSGMVIEVTVRNTDGASVGSRSFFVGGGSFVHLQFPITSVFANPAVVNAGAVDFKITSGDGAVVPYASVIDNATADAVFVGGQFPPNTPFAKSGKPSAFRELFQRYSLNPNQ